VCRVTGRHADKSIRPFESGKVEKHPAATRPLRPGASQECRLPILPTWEDKRQRPCRGVGNRLPPSRAKTRRQGAFQPTAGATRCGSHRRHDANALAGGIKQKPPNRSESARRLAARVSIGRHDDDCIRRSSAGKPFGDIADGETVSCRPLVRGQAIGSGPRSRPESLARNPHGMG
jgi:hypothetical protein